MTAKLRDIDSDAPASRRARAAKRPLVVALVGRPNSGKSSLYNAVTGGNAHVGNYPGITVEILEGQAQLADGTSIAIADLPGFYSVEATVDTGTDEGVARAFLDALKKDDARDHVVVQVADATRLGLALRLTRELVHAGVPLVVALTHADVIEREGRTIDTAALGDAIGAPVVLVNARKPAAKLAVLAAVEQVSSLTARAENLSFDPAELARTVVRDVGTEREKTRRKVTERIDRVLLHPLIGPVLFVSIMAALFAAVFLVADPASAVMDRVIGLVRAKVTSTFGRNLATSFFVDGILGGAGTVLAFMPQIVILTVALELLEASGYLARGAFLVDRLLRLLGLSGRSFLPLLMAHACAVPAVQATRVIRDPRERLTTILVLPFMSCSARLPTYGLVIATFFAARSAFFKAGVFVSLYFAGMLTALLASLVLRRTATKGRGLPLVLEMPSYRVPQASVVARKAARSATRFLRDVGTAIVAASAVLWLLVSIPAPGATGATPIESSIAASVGRAVEPITRPAGFDWRVNVGLIASFGQRELMVSTMGVIFGVENAEDDPTPLTVRLREAKKPDGTPLYSTRMALALLAFFVLACQCMSTIAAIRRETSSFRWPAFVIAYTYALAYAASVAIYQLGGVLGVS